MDWIKAPDLAGVPRNTPSGVICEKCSTEMVIPEPWCINTSYPPCQDIICRGCGNRGYRTYVDGNQDPNDMSGRLRFVRSEET